MATNPPGSVPTGSVRQPRDYHVPEIRELLAELRARATSKADTGRLVDLELLLTDGFLLYGSQLLAGRLDAATLHPNWRAERRERDMVGLLEEAVRDGGPAAVLDGLRPSQPGYRTLMGALAAYRRIEARGGWAAVPEAVAGETGPPDLRSPDGSRVYDEALAEAVRSFQRRHGLEPDAVVGPGTLAALNATPAERMRQLEVNLERWRWLPGRRRPAPATEERPELLPAPGRGRGRDRRRPARASFALAYHGQVVPWRQFLLRALPGEEVALEIRPPSEALGGPPGARTRGGAPVADSIVLTAPVLVPLSEARGGRVRGYRVGSYPDEMFCDLPRMACAQRVPISLVQPIDRSPALQPAHLRRRRRPLCGHGRRRKNGRPDR